jgi:GLPGLI family protein
MTTISKLIVATFILMFATATAQDFHGVATYKSHRKMDFKMGGEGSNPEFDKQIQEQLKKQFQKEYTLIFNQEASIYEQNEELAKPSPVSSNGITIEISNGSDVLYKNVKEHRYTNQTEMYGKQFLIKDSLISRKWELVNETKNIGDYTCFKAIYKDSITSTTFTDNGEMEETKKERITTAWYTPQIPVNNGPQDFEGLPGLILEINDGSLTLVCTKIVINPKDKTDIVEPSKGKEVTSKEFQAIMDKKNKEMMDDMKARNRGNSNSSSRVMIIGG